MSQERLTPISKKDFYYLRFTAVEWRYLLTKLINSVEIEAWNDYIITTHEETGEWVYMLNKKRFPAALIAKALNTDAAKIENMPIIRLHEPSQNKGLPKPTVDYWGTA